MAEHLTTVAGQVVWRKPRQSIGGFAGSSVVLAVMALFILYPLLLLLYGSFLVPRPGGQFAFSLDAWTTTWTLPGAVQSLWNTFQRTIVTEVISLPVAILIAWLVARTDIPGKRLIDGFFWLAMFFPALPVLMGWIFFLFDPDNGVANTFLRNTFGLSSSPFNIYSFSGIIFAHLASRSIAAKYIFLVPAFRNIDSSMEEASHIVGGSTIDTLRRIILPVLTPAILITMVVSLIHSLESFEIELILGPPTNFYVFSTKMYQLVHQDPPLYNSATVLGIATLVLMLPLIIWQQRVTAVAGRFATVTSRFQERPLRLGQARWLIFAVLAAFGFVITIVPAACLVAGTFMNLFGHFELPVVWSTRHWREILDDQSLLGALTNTLTLSAAAAFFGTLWFALVAYISVRTRYPARKALDFTAWIPAMLPGVIISLGLLWMFLTVPGLRSLYGTMAVLVIAVIINFLTSGVQLIKSNMVQLSFDFEEASFLAGAGWIQTFRRIVLPLVGPVLISVALLTFNTAARNVANIVMLVTRDTAPLSVLQIDYMVDGQYEPAAIIGVIIVFLSVFAAFVARWLARHFGFRTL